jgi:hypothetical protein
LAAVIEVEHRSHGIYSQAINVIFVQPVQGAAEKKTPYFVPIIVENKTVPIGMNTLSGITVLIEMGSIEISQSVFIIGEMGRYPIEDDTYVMLVQIINEVHKVPWGAVATCGGEVSRGLITPGAVEGVLHDR